MQLTGPKITVHSTDSLEWLVQIDDAVSATNGLERISITVLVPKGEGSLPQVQTAAMRRAAQMIQTHLDAADRYQAGKPPA